jgi:transcription antitermination protein NusB
MGKPAEQTTSPKAKALSARLSAVQALYQAMQNGQSMESALEEYLYDRAGMEVDGEKLVLPDGALLKKILLGVGERRGELEEIVRGNLTKRKEGDNSLTQEPEDLLMAVLLCGTYELLAHKEIDSPIIINDYLHVTHAFFEGGAASLVNGVLDSVGKILRY